MWAGYLGAAALWYACVAWLPLESFRRLPDPVAVLTVWLSPQPTYGISIFTGLQIAMGAAWFSLAAGEMIAAQYGLGFLIMESYNLIQFPTIVIAMATLGLLGYLSSALIRLAGNRLMRWREQSMGFA